MDGTRLLEALQANHQEIRLKGSSEHHSFGINETNVTVTASPLSQHASSSKVQIKNIVDYGWEQKYYIGKIVAVHVSGNYMAYGIKIHEKNVGVVRIVNRKTGERGLLKGLSGFVCDLSFAHITDQVILACIDEVGNLFVYQVFEDESNKMNCVSVLQVTQPDPKNSSEYHRVIWCQYIPEDPVDDADSSADDALKYLVMTNDDKAQILNIAEVSKHHGSGPILSTDIRVGCQVITDHRQPIVDASFSPDGAALATASLDGEVKFFQVYMHSDTMSPRCLHQWKPHNGRPLSCLFFLDNHKNPNPEVQFWKLAITGADNNRELKIWSCESWNCLQTINFEIPETGGLEHCFKAGLDLSASYLLLSDINRKVLYVLLITQNTEIGTAKICSVSEFGLSFAMLSFAIADASRKKYRTLPDSELIDDVETVTLDNDTDDDRNLVDGVVVRLLHIQPKSLQECRIAFQPQSSVPLNTSLTSISQDSIAFRDRLTDASFDTSVCNESDLMTTDDLVISSTARVQSSTCSHTPSVSTNSTQQILLTPESFTSPNHSSATAAFVASFSLGGTPPTGVTIPLPPVTPSEEAKLGSTPYSTPLSMAAESVPANVSAIMSTSISGTMSGSLSTLDAETEPKQTSGRSSGSSPSLEVQQILATRKTSVEEDKNDEDEVDEKIMADLIIMDNVENSHVVTASIAVSQSTSKSPKVVSPPIPTTANVTRQYDTNAWPPAPPIPTIPTQMSSEHVHLRKTNSGTYDGAGDGVPDIGAALELKFLEKKMEGWLDRVQNTLRHMNHCHQTEIADLRSELQKHHSLSGSLELVVRHLEKLDGSISVIQNKQLEQKRFEDILHNFEERERQRQDRMIPSVTQAITNVLGSKLEHYVKTEIRSSVLPSVAKQMESFKDQLHMEVAHKLSATDSLMKENINKLVKSKGTIEAIAAATSTSIQEVLGATFKDLVVPSFERSCHTMFQQMNDCFLRGTKEYVQQLENHLERRKMQVEQSRDPFIDQLQSSLDSFQLTSDQLKMSLVSSLQEEVQRQIQTNTTKLQDNLLHNIQFLIKDEITNAIKEQQTAIGSTVLNAIRSRAVTPTSSVVDPEVQRSHINQLIKAGQLNTAFQQALSASDLTLVVFVCEAVPPEDVFSKHPCPLHQPVLLSLIQQLSADLNTRTELKLKYLQDAVLNLDKSNPVIREHVHPVLTSLRQKLQEFISVHPTSEYVRVVKMLLLASQSVLAN